jgi:hypothetical protein
MFVLPSGEYRSQILKLDMSKVLVLNASYEPLNITGWRRAVILMLKGKAEQVENIYTGTFHCQQ